MADTIDIARWYCVSRQGMATLCLDESDARNVVVECDGDWPLNAPHRAVLMGDVASMRTEIDRLRSELEAVEADARRYQWLRSRVPGGSYRIMGVIYSDGGDGVDAAIDAAMNDRKEV